jgi:hypothetical protein
VRRTYERLLTGMVVRFEAGMEPADRDARQAALGDGGALCGGMVLARTLEDADLAEGIREAARTLALDIAGIDGAAPVSAIGSSDRARRRRPDSS